MGKRYQALEKGHIDFIRRQPLYFVASAAPQGRVNLSPKGLDTLRVLDRKRILWLNLTGSGNETAAHLRQDARMTLMFCAFTGPPLILRCYGQARTVHPRDNDWVDLYRHFEPVPGARQIFDLAIDLVQTSCGMGVPLLDVVSQRDALPAWGQHKGEDGLHDYWREHNRISLDGLPSGIDD